MYVSRTTFVIALLLGWMLTTAADAHFLWIVPNASEKQVRVYFSENAEADDPDLLDPVADVKLWGYEDQDKPSEIGLQKNGDALVGNLGDEQTFALSREYGVMSRGKETFLLHYHAMAYGSPFNNDWKGVKNPQQLALELVPQRRGNQVELQLLWQGKPLANTPIIISGAGLDKLEISTNTEGKCVCQPAKNGMLIARAKNVEATAGKKNDKAYDSVRHWTTLTVPFHKLELNAQDKLLPPIPKGMTSFGAAATSDALYIYGGHWGGAHHYWQAGQSNELVRLDLHAPQSWQVVATGPRRTGTAMVAYQNKIYRVGGFEVLNKEGEKDDLHSQADVECYDPAANRWNALPAMPMPRSSHDAVILGSTIYVVGGWDLQKGREGDFHNTLLTFDLAAEKPAWNVVTAPFKRRAVSAAEHEGKIYVLGGMQEDSSVSTEVDIYAPQTQTWSKGPAFHGADLDGFGTTAFTIDKRLLLVTRNGAVQRLATDGKSWEIAGQLNHPRFFARLIPLTHGGGVVIAGADMKTGKVLATEVIK